MKLFWARSNRILIVWINCGRNKNALVHSYKHGLSGFAAHLSDSEAHQLTNEPGVVSVFPDPVYQLHTTRSWDFLQREISLLTDSQPRSNAPVLSSQGSDTIIGILDTGKIIKEKLFLIS